jgi:hypothetical protein
MSYIFSQDQIPMPKPANVRVFAFLAHKSGVNREKAAADEASGSRVVV